MFKKKKRNNKKRFEYKLPEDADTIRIEALGMGAICATREYPVMKNRATLESEARVSLATLRSKNPRRYCNDFESMCNIYIPYYICGFQDTMSRYQSDQARYEGDKAYIAEHGWIRAFKEFQANYTPHLESIKAEMDATPEWNQLL